MIRAIALILFIAVAALGAGLSGVVLTSRERFQNNEVRIEMVDSQKKKEETQNEENDGN